MEIQPNAFSQAQLKRPVSQSTSDLHSSLDTNQDADLATAVLPSTLAHELPERSMHGTTDISSDHNNSPAAELKKAAHFTDGIRPVIPTGIDLPIVSTLGFAAGLSVSAGIALISAGGLIAGDVNYGLMGLGLGTYGIYKSITFLGNGAAHYWSQWNSDRHSPEAQLDAEITRIAKEALCEERGPVGRFYVNHPKLALSLELGAVITSCIGLNAILPIAASHAGLVLGALWGHLRMLKPNYDLLVKKHALFPDCYLDPNTNFDDAMRHGTKANLERETW